jgi:signal transduction histidine kinase
MTTQARRRSIDWSQFWCPGRRQPFSADEMARAGGDPPSPTLLAVTALNAAVLAFAVLQVAPAAQTPRLAAALAALALAAAWLARWLWWRPWRRPLLVASLGLGAAMLLLMLGSIARIHDRNEAYAVVLTLSLVGVMAIILLTLLVLWRAQQIEGRLREQAERAKAIEMARRLASAQVEPHFLFNTLASLQHWVQTRDERAAPMLEALTGYLRATLPLFDRPLLAAADELRAVERYLQVMQARLGAERLRWRVEVEPDAARAQLPPGLLLTLVENAVTHGVEPQLAGGSVTVRGARRGAEVVFEVDDNGPGPGAGAEDGTGLANVRQRLALHADARATLRVAPGPDGGCRAEIRLPWSAAGASA